MLRRQQTADLVFCNYSFLCVNSFDLCGTNSSNDKILILPGHRLTSNVNGFFNAKLAIPEKETSARTVHFPFLDFTRTSHPFLRQLRDAFTFT